MSASPHMSKPKYKAEFDEHACYVTEIDTGRIKALADGIESVEWLVSELNTLNWAVETLLKKLEEPK